MKKILIIGATGLLGQPVVNAFVNNKFQVKALVRNVENAKNILNDSVELFEGNVLDATNIKKALIDCDAIHINLNGELEQTGTFNIIRAAQESNINRISYISGASVCNENSWHIMIKRKLFAEKLIIESGISYCIFRPSWFMDSLPRFVNGNKAFMFGNPTNKWHLVSANDYAEMVVKSYQIDNAINKIFFIYGPEEYTLPEALSIYIKKIHPEIEKISSFSYRTMKIIAFFSGKKRLKETISSMEYFEKVSELDGPDEANQILGKPRTTLNNWILNLSSEESV